MADLKLALNEEIRRLARKEIRQTVQPLQATVVSLRRQIAELKKELAAVSKQQDSVVRAAVASGSKDLEPKEPKLRLNAAGIIRIRKKLKLTQAEFASLLDVTMHTVSFWEQGKCAPRESVKARICALRKAGKREISKRLADAKHQNAPETD